jgi:hypothetical protein
LPSQFLHFIFPLPAFFCMFSPNQAVSSQLVEARRQHDGVHE